MTQAAVLCQFLHEVDYATAFRCLQERNGNDAMDSLYGCMWDTTMLEYVIHLHHKRGETRRKAQAVSVLFRFLLGLTLDSTRLSLSQMKAIGMLELNCNNNEEIQREASAQRRAHFLRSLAKQYL